MLSQDSKRKLNVCVWYTELIGGIGIESGEWDRDLLYYSPSDLF